MGHTQLETPQTLLSKLIAGAKGKSIPSEFTVQLQWPQGESGKETASECLARSSSWLPLSSCVWRRFSGITLIIKILPQHVTLPKKCRICVMHLHILNAKFYDYVYWVICHIGTHTYRTHRHHYTIETHTCTGPAWVHMNEDTALSLIQDGGVTHHLLCS